MRSTCAIGLAAIALCFGIGGTAAAPIDSLQSSALQVDTAAGSSLQPPAGMRLNDKGLAAIRSAGGESAASDSTISELAASSSLSGTVKTWTDEMVRPPEAAENVLSNNLLSGSSRATTDNMLRPPSE